MNDPNNNAARKCGRKSGQGKKLGEFEKIKFEVHANLNFFTTSIFWLLCP
jgi:hypothetical protein